MKVLRVSFFQEFPEEPRRDVELLRTLPMTELASAPRAGEGVLFPDGTYWLVSRVAHVVRTAPELVVYVLAAGKVNMPGPSAPRRTMPGPSEGEEGGTC